MCGRRLQNNFTIVKGVRMYAEDSKRLVFCVLPKTGVTSFKSFLVKVATGQSEVNFYVHNDRALRRRGVDIIDRGPFPAKYNGYFKFLEVRHPFTRLISAWKDKVYPASFSKKALERAARNATVELTWVRFAEYVAKQNDSLTNRHWQTFGHLCPICNLDFNAITKLESISRDIEYIKEVNRIEGDVNFDRKNAASGPPGKTTDDYMQELPEEVFAALKERYSEDMKLFGYDVIEGRKLTCGYLLEDCC
jgi:hypothetical protein